MRFLAYWIGPDGKVIPVGTRHIESIIQNPKLFGIDRSYIGSIYKKYKEPIGHEGKAREELMTNLMKRGWIRVRYVNNGGWYFEIIRLSEKIKGNILDFVSQGMQQGFINRNTNISVGQVNGISSSSPASDLISGKVELENKMASTKLMTMLQENPDKLSSPLFVSWTESDACAFGYYNGKFYLDKNYNNKVVTHGDLVDIPNKNVDRPNFKFPGRIWTRHRVISFWTYPHTIQEWNKVIADIKSKLPSFNVNSYKLELPKTITRHSKIEGDWFAADIGESEVGYVKLNAFLDSLKGNVKPIKIPSQDKGQEHVKSPLLKQKKEVPPGMGSEKRPAGLSRSQYYALAGIYAEGSMKLKQFLKEIKRRRK